MRNNDTSNFELIYQLKNELNEINPSEQSSGSEMIQSVQCSFLDENNILCVNKQISFSISSSPNKFYQVIQILIEYIKLLQKILLKTEKDKRTFSHQTNYFKERNEIMLKENSLLKKKILKIIESVHEFDFEEMKERKKMSEIISLVLKENEYLRECILNTNSISDKSNRSSISNPDNKNEANKKAEAKNTKNKFDIIGAETINKRNMRMKEIEKEIKFLAEGRDYN